MPKTLFVPEPGSLGRSLSDLKFPVVIKPFRSRVLVEGNWISTSVSYAYSVMELESTIEKTEYLRENPFLLQEYVQGEGRGIFFLYDRGKPIRVFAHKRLREKPPSGGVSVFSESVELEPGMREIAQSILDHVQWHGVAMAEFKMSSEGVPYLMEVNARFWGSLQLAIDAGVDFPWLLYQLAVGERIERVESYKIGVKSRWLLGDFDHLYLQLTKNCVPPLHFREKWNTIIQFIRFFERNVHYEVNRWNDLEPFLFEIHSYLRNQDSPKWPELKGHPNG